MGCGGGKRVYGSLLRFCLTFNVSISKFYYTEHIPFKITLEVLFTEVDKSISGTLGTSRLCIQDIIFYS